MENERPLTDAEARAIMDRIHSPRTLAHADRTAEAKMTSALATLLGCAGAIVVLVGVAVSKLF